MRAVGLLRVSTPDQAESGWGLPEQRQAIQGYCHRQGLTLVELCEDDGISGRLAERPAVRRALELAKAGLIDTLVLVKLDRLGRENRVIQDLLHRCRALKLRVLFVEHASGDTPANRLLLNVLGGVSEFELEQIRKRTMDGRRGKAEDGRMPVAFNCYGYELVRRWEEEADPTGQVKSGTIRIREAEAELVRELFRRHAAGESLNSITNWLNESGYVTRRGNAWRVTSLKRLLENPAYKGEARYGWRSVNSYVERDGPEERKRFHVERQEDWVTIPCPAIVDPELWAAVEQRMADTSARMAGRPSNLWPLRGVVECASCVGKRGAPAKACGQRKLTNPKRKGYHQRFYVCPLCKTCISAKKWEARARTALEYGVAPGVLAEQALRKAHAERKQLGDPERLVRQFQAEIEKLDQEERRLLEVAMHISPHLIAEKAAALRKRREQAQLGLQGALASYSHLEDLSRLAERAEARAARARAALAEAGDDPEKLQPIYREYLRIRILKHHPPEVEVLL